MQSRPSTRLQKLFSHFTKKRQQPLIEPRERPNMRRTSLKAFRERSHSLSHSASDSNFITRNQALSVVLEPEREERSVSQRVRRAATSAVHRSLRLKNEDETYAQKALSSPVNFLKWFFRLTLMTVFARIGSFIGGQIGCAIERRNKCEEDILMILQGKFLSIPPLVCAAIFGGLGAVLVRYLWNKASGKITKCFKKCQNCIKNSKPKLVFFLSGFYGTTTFISGCLGVVVEKYGENNIWPRQNNGVEKGMGAGMAFGAALAIALLVKPLINCVTLKRRLLCKKPRTNPSLSVLEMSRAGEIMPPTACCQQEESLLASHSKQDIILNIDSPTGKEEKNQYWQNKHSARNDSPSLAI